LESNPGFSEASYYVRRSKVGSMDVSDAKGLKLPEAENSRLTKLLAESMLENEVTRDVRRKRWWSHRRIASWCGRSPCRMTSAQYAKHVAINGFDF